MQILVALVRLPLTCLIITIKVGLIRCSVSAWNCTVHMTPHSSPQPPTSSIPPYLLCSKLMFKYLASGQQFQRI